MVVLDFFRELGTVTRWNIAECQPWLSRPTTYLRASELPRCHERPAANSARRSSTELDVLAPSVVRGTDRKVGGMRVSIDPEGTEIEVVHELVDFSGKKVLEVGCGDGRMTRRYADRAALVLALDLNAEKIQRAIDSTPEPLRSKVRFRVADIADAELAQQAFDVAILSHSL